MPYIIRFSLKSNILWYEMWFCGLEKCKKDKGCNDQLVSNIILHKTNTNMRFRNAMWFGSTFWNSWCGGKK
jgi:hypothetical protein